MRFLRWALLAFGSAASPIPEGFCSVALAAVVHHCAMSRRCQRARGKVFTLMSDKHRLEFVPGMAFSRSS